MQRLQGVLGQGGDKASGVGEATNAEQSYEQLLEAFLGLDTRDPEYMRQVRKWGFAGKLASGFQCSGRPMVSSEAFDGANVVRKSWPLTLQSLILAPTSSLLSTLPFGTHLNPISASDPNPNSDP